MIEIRAEAPGDEATIHRLNEAAFEDVAEATIVDALRDTCDAFVSFVVVLGHPEYYPRFGFEKASRHGLVSQWDGVPDEAFMITVFDREALPKAGGVARYRDDFDAAM